MFDGMNLNDRILRSRFDHTVNCMVYAASGAEDSMQGMEVYVVSYQGFSQMARKTHVE